MRNFKNPFAYDKDNNLIWIKNKDYENKDKYSNCFCPKCKEKLIAKMGNNNLWHFAHKNNTYCDGNYESCLHQYAKNVIATNNNIILPQIEIDEYLLMHKVLNDRNRNMYKIRRNLNLSMLGKLSNRSNIVFFENLYKYQWISNEMEIKNFRPDCLVEIKDKKLCIEIAVTHKCDEDKINKVMSANLDMIEIDLENLYNNLGQEEIDLDEYILKRANRRWIFKTRIDKIDKKIMMQEIEFEKIHYLNNVNKYEIKNRACMECGLIFEENDTENMFYINTFGMDKECFEMKFLGTKNK